MTVNKVVDELEPDHDAHDGDLGPAIDNLALFRWVSEMLPTAENLEPQLGDPFEIRGSQISATHRDWASDQESADPHVIAAAELLGCSVVSTETPKHNVITLQNHRSNTGQYPRKTSIPSMCQILGVRHTNLVGLFGLESWLY